MLPSAFPTTTHYVHARPGAACHPGGLASAIARSLPPQGLSLPWPACPLEGLHPHGVAPNTASPQEKACSPEKLEQAWPGRENICLILGQSFCVGLPWGRASWVHSGPASHSSPWGVPHSHRIAAQHPQSTGGAAAAQKKLEQAWPGCVKICLHSQTVLLSQAALGRASWVLSDSDSCSNPGGGGAALLQNSCPAPPAPCKSPTAQKHQSKLCPAK